MLIAIFLLAFLETLVFCLPLQEVEARMAGEKRDSILIRTVLAEIGQAVDKMTADVAKIGTKRNAFKLYQKANAESLDVVNDGISRISRSPKMGYLETVTWSLVVPMNILGSKIDAMMAALKAKREIIEQDGLTGKLITELKKSLSAASALTSVVLQNMSMSAITGPIGFPVANALPEKYRAAIRTLGGDPARRAGSEEIEKESASSSSAEPSNPVPQPVPQYPWTMPASIQPPYPVVAPSQPQNQPWSQPFSFVPLPYGATPQYQSAPSTFLFKPQLPSSV